MFQMLYNWFTISVITLLTLYWYGTRKYRYWKSLGVSGPRPLPFIGTFYQRFQRPLCQYNLENYRRFGKIYGFYEGSRPVLSLAIPELIRDICVKDFNVFVDRLNVSFGDPLFDRSLLTAKGEQWKHIRTIVSPSFSSGKLRKMQTLIKDCVERLDKALEETARSGEELDLRQSMVNYTMDVIALCAFATKINTHNTGTELHPFIKHSQIFFKPSLRIASFFLMNAIMPSVVKKLQFSFVPKNVWNYFRSTLKTIITEREAKNMSNNTDFLQLLVDAKKKTDLKDVDEDIKRDIETISKTLTQKNYTLEEIDILATSLLFLLAGHETTASTLSYLFHELSLNPECQQKLYEEISSYGTSVSIEDILQMPYLDACVSETLRKYSPTVFTQRVANRDYELGDTGLVIPKGMSIQIPIYAMNYDPQYYPNPEQFSPDRFIPENKSRLTPYAFIPFGVGPRNCIGLRFASINIKTAIVSVLSKYRFKQTPNTKTKFEYKKFVVFTQAKDMGSVGIELRQ